MCHMQAKSIKVALDSLENKLSSVTTLTSEACEAFISAVYTAVEVTGTNDGRYWMLYQKCQSNENHRPMSDSLQQHMRRGNYQDCVWKKALEAKNYHRQMDSV